MPGGPVRFSRRLRKLQRQCFNTGRLVAILLQAAGFSRTFLVNRLGELLKVLVPAPPQNFDGDGIVKQDGTGKPSPFLPRSVVKSQVASRPDGIMGKFGRWAGSRL
jgi:hypothetical protein